MESVVDSVGRVVIPKPLRNALGMTPGTLVAVTRYGNGIQITVGGRTARLKDAKHGLRVATGHTPIDDDVVFGLIDASRR